MRHLEASPDEIESLYRDLPVEVTQFCRDHSAFELIQEEIVPRNLEQASPDDGIRVWVPGAAIRLVALTGFGRAEDHSRVIEAGFDATLSNP